MTEIATKDKWLGKRLRMIFRDNPSDTWDETLSKQRWLRVLNEKSREKLRVYWEEMREEYTIELQ